MNSAAGGLRIEAGSGKAALSGKVDFSTVPALSRQPLAADGDRPLTVDLVGVEHIDSAGLALLVHWAARAQARGGSVRFVNLPAQLEAMARLCDLEEMFGLQEAASRRLNSGPASPIDKRIA